MLSLLKKIVGTESSRTLKRIEPLIAQINALESGLSILTDEALRAKTVEFKERLAEARKNTEGVDNANILNSLLPEAFAVVREASKRTRGERQFDVQLMGGIILHEGGIAEMRTGEGKTLVATLPAYLNALSGKGVHVVTVNDYLSRRDAVWMGQIYSFLGLSVGVINHEESFLYDPKHSELDTERDTVGSFKVVNEFLRPVTRREAYEADITYGTNNEFGFDYLRDNIEYEADRLRQREHAYAIVDEIDSILIDEARTPLIISAPAGDSGELYAKFADIAKKLEPVDHYIVDEKFKTISLTDAGIERVEKLLGLGNMYTEKGVAFVHHLETAVRAEALYTKDKDYVIKDNGNGEEVVIVDEFTGRLQPGRRWSEGLHQAIEAKEHVPIQKESKTYASITFQNYFRMYKKLSGMTGTAITSSEEFYKVYGLTVLSVPTHRPMLRNDKNDMIFQTEAGKYKAIAREVKSRFDAGQPVLIGTVSIQKNEMLSEYLKVEGIPHEVLNAKNHSREGEIIAQAGRKGGVTIATNMAGRGVDIKLGGNPGSKEVYEEIKSLGGLFVLGTERHDARRIDNQLRGRSGRQGDPGDTQFFVSMEDHLMRVFGGDGIKNLMGRLGIKEDEPIENGMITRSLETAQEKIEGFNFDARKHVLEFDDVLNFQRKIMYARRREILLDSGEKVKGYIEEIFKSIKGVEEDPGHIHMENNDVNAQFVQDIIASADAGLLGALRRVILQTIDTYWIEHLEVMDYMRSSVNLRAYGQRDPLVEYKREGLKLFKDMEVAVGQDILKLIPQIAQNMKTQLENGVSSENIFALAQPSGNALRLVETQEGSESLTVEPVQPALSAPHTPDGQKIGRNDSCFCGSGKKYKKCGELNTEEHQKLMSQP